MDSISESNAIQGDSKYYLPELCLEEERIEILPNSFFETLEHPLAIDRLFEDEELYMGDSSLAALDSHTLPALFGWASKRPQKDKNSSRILKKLKELLWSEERLNAMSLCLCKYADLIPELHLTLTKYSPLVSLLPDYKCTLAQLFKEILRFSLKNIYEAIAGEKGQYKGLLEREVSVEMENCDVSMCDGLCQSVSMSDVSSSFTTGKTHKKWSRAEETELMNTLKRYEVGEIPKEVWNELALKFNRTITSLHAKVKSLQKRPNTKGEAKTYNEMITSILNSFPNQIATKEEITSLICRHYNLDQHEVEKSIGQCLAKKFERIPKVYKLKEAPMVSKDKAESVKDKLVYVLNELGGKGTLEEIRLKYQEEFKDCLDKKMTINSNQAVWEKTITKTLLKCKEFQKEKTKYTFKRFTGL